MYCKIPRTLLWINSLVSENVTNMKEIVASASLVAAYQQKENAKLTCSIN
jgi:hypothetical protein